jgi:hypothetical protein
MKCLKGIDKFDMHIGAFSIELEKRIMKERLLSCTVTLVDNWS